MRAALNGPFIVLLILSVLALTGCGKRRGPGDDRPEPEVVPVAQDKDAAQPPQGNNPPPPEKRAAGALGAPRRQQIQNDLRQIALFYVNYCTLHRKGPPNTKAFADSIRRDARALAEALDNNVYHLVPRVRGGSGVVLAFDVAGDEDGNHIVVMGDSSVDTLTRQELEERLMKQGK
jgi:hypothetical protein